MELGSSVRTLLAAVLLALGLLMIILDALGQI